MSSRFEPLFALEKNLYAEDSPVIVSAGMLLRDTESKRLAAQLKFRNVSSKTIWALTVTLACVDTGGQPTAEEFTYQYQDLTAARGEEFGSKKAILIPDGNTRGFSVTEISAVFSDGTAVTVPVKLSPLPPQTPLTEALTDPQLVKQYRIAANDSAQYVPVTDRGLHLCPCGQWHSQPFCTLCGLAYEQAEQAYDIPALTEAMGLRLETEAADREEQRRADIYEAAVKDLAGGKLQKLRSAEAAFTELGDYRDSADLVAQCRAGIKDIALGKMQNPKSPYDYAEAEKIFRSLGDVDDNKALAEQCHAKFTTSKDHQADKLKKLVKRLIIAAVVIALIVVMVPVTRDQIIPAVKYSQAEKLAEEAQYDEAIAAFEALGEYKDASVRIADARYSKALSLMESGAYLEAAEIFDGLDDYLYSRDWHTECIYLQGKTLMDAEEYEAAIEQLLTIGKYEDAPALLDNCYQVLAEAEYNNEQYKAALTWYSKIEALDTANTVYTDCVYRCAMLDMEAEDYESAVSLLAQIPDYSDSAAKQQEAMYAYITAHNDFHDETTMEYAAKLAEAEYEDSADLHAALIAAAQAEVEGIEIPNEA